MQASRMDSSETEALPPFPEGWYFVASRESILKQKLIQKTWLGEEIVVWCDGQGNVCVADAFCPHLGSRLGPASGGKVRDGCLVCPFHGFEFDVSGQCVATPYAPAPVSARLKLFETRDLLGMVFAWWGSGGKASQWSLPEDPQVGEGWSKIAFHHFHFPGHPQETTENSVDLAHLRFVHGYDNVRQVGPLLIDGAYFRSCFDFASKTSFAGIKQILVDVSTVTHVHGLGFSYVEFEERSVGFKARMWVLATPVDGTQIHLVLASQVGHMAHPKRPIVGLRFLPERLRLPVLNRMILSRQVRYVSQDVVIWERKHFRPRPRLNRADGEIIAYRRYCEQFYPEFRNVGRRLRSSGA